MRRTDGLMTRDDPFASSYLGRLVLTSKFVCLFWTSVLYFLVKRDFKILVLCMKLSFLLLSIDRFWSRSTYLCFWISYEKLVF